MSKSIEERIEFLRKCARLYETSGNSHISDAEYDLQYAELKALAPDDPFFSEVGGIDADHAYGTPYVHKYVMGSLNKSPDTKDFGDWFAKAYPDTSGVVALLDLKVDGTALCCHYEDGNIKKEGDSDYQ